VSSTIRTSDDISAAWLAQVLDLGDVSDVVARPIGTGQMSQSLRVSYRHGGELAQVVVKLAATDPTSRATGVALGAYSREVAFYRHASTWASGSVPRCLYAEYDSTEGWFSLILEDLHPAAPGDQIAGCSPEVARYALDAVAAVHAPVLGNHVLGGQVWLTQPNPLTQDLYNQVLGGFLNRYGDRVSPEHREVVEEFGSRVDAWLADRRPPLGLVHGDFRLDNLLFLGERCTIVDWQTVAWGPAMRDVAYFLGGSLTVADRRTHEYPLVRGYHQALTAAGASGLTWEQCWLEYRRQSFYGVLMSVIASMIVERTERGDDMFTTLLARHAQHVLDVDGLELLATDGSASGRHLSPAPVDEGLHAPGPELLWNESWYEDAVSDDGSLGIYVRLGRLPNQGKAFYAVCICGSGRPSVMLVIEDGPLPDAADPTQAIRTAGLRAEQHCEEPLRRFRISVSGTAQAHADPAAPLRGEVGTPVQVSLDLVWETDGSAYAWRQATRYEIPCRVRGTVDVGNESFEFTGKGQRDHSWGVRDWWSVDWMWSALHLNDGTRLHAVAVPALPAHGVGYVQRDGDVLELSAVETSHTLTIDGLIGDATIELHPSALRVAVEPIAFGVLRLESPDGRISHFPRAMCNVRTPDGRSGSGWVEWNRVQR